MTILGVPDGGGFTIGTSSNIAASTGVANKMDMSLGKFPWINFYSYAVSGICRGTN